MPATKVDALMVRRASMKSLVDRIADIDNRLAAGGDIDIDKLLDQRLAYAAEYELLVVDGP